jgi:predicted lipoprotein with Yx(FWY)xxD motif
VGVALWPPREARRRYEVARLAGAGLLGASGAIHLDLYLTGYGRIPTIGPLFLAQATSALVLAVFLLTSRGAIVALAGSLLALSTLGAYTLSLLVPLFGFREVRTTAGIVSALVEIFAASALGASALGAAGFSARFGARCAAGAGLAAALGVSLALGVGTSPQPASGQVVAARWLPPYGSVLVSSKGYSLYLLSSEAHGRIVCQGACLSIWPPLLVKVGVRPRGKGRLAGRLGVLRRSDGEDEVTYNGYPLYLYAGDGRPKEATGEGVVSFGGTWYLVRAAATTSSATPLR